MTLTELIVSIASAIFGLSVSAAYGVLGYQWADYKYARLAFGFAGASFITLPIIWGTTTDVNTVTRCLVVSIIASFAACAAMESVRWVNRRQQMMLTPTSAKPASIGLKCNMGSLPTQADKNLRILFIQVVESLPDPGRDTALYAGITRQTPGDYAIEKFIPRNYGTRCTIANYSGRAIVDLKINAKVKWLHAIKQSDRVTSGEIFAEAEIMLSDFDLESSENQLTPFFAYNRSKAFIQISFADEALALFGDSGKWEVVKLLNPHEFMSRTINLFPNEPL